jgi:hypothetical protein
METPMRITAFPRPVRLTPVAAPKFSSDTDPSPNPPSPPPLSLNDRLANLLLGTFIASRLPQFTLPKDPDESAASSPSPHDPLTAFIANRLPRFEVPPPDALSVARSCRFLSPQSRLDPVEPVKTLLGEPIQNWIVTTNDSPDGYGQKLGVFYGHPEDIAAHFHAESPHGLTLARAKNQYIRGTEIPQSQAPSGTRVKLNFSSEEDTQYMADLLTFKLSRNGLDAALKAWLDTQPAKQKTEKVILEAGDTHMTFMF